MTLAPTECCLPLSTVPHGCISMIFTIQSATCFTSSITLLRLIIFSLTRLYLYAFLHGTDYSFFYARYLYHYSLICLRGVIIVVIFIWRYLCSDYKFCTEMRVYEHR